MYATGGVWWWEEAVNWSCSATLLFSLLVLANRVVRESGIVACGMYVCMAWSSVFSDCCWENETRCHAFVVLVVWWAKPFFVLKLRALRSIHNIAIRWQSGNPKDLPDAVGQQHKEQLILQYSHCSLHSSFHSPSGYREFKPVMPSRDNNMNTQTIEVLQAQLSPKASINHAGSVEYLANTERWSHFNAPSAGAVINVNCEADIEKTVQWATANKIPFVAQAGGHGWTAALKRVQGDAVVINLRGVKYINIDAEKGEARLGGGVLTGDVLDAAYAAKVHIGPYLSLI